jgi:LPXTG-motif cell wall-anchored protein
MSTNTKLGIAVLGLALVGGIGYVVYKRRQGGGSPKMAQNRGTWNATSRRMVRRKR